MTTHVFPPPLDRHYPIVDGKVATRSLESHVVDHCNLTCAECCSLSPLLPRWQIEPADLARDLARAAQVLAPRVFKLVGGEPLLHPDIVELVRIARTSGIAPTVSITTNGLLLPRMPDALWDAVDALTISLYPRPALEPETIALVEERAARFGVALNWKRQDEFVVMTRDEPTTDASETVAIYDACWIRERCHMLRDGRFYTCTRPPHFTSYYRGDHDFTGDGIPLEGADLADRLLAYLRRDTPLATCAHCLGGAAAQVPHRLLTRDELVRLRR
jgi:hypothetical protein